MLVVCLLIFVKLHWSGQERKLGRLVWPDGPRMPKVQCGVSVPSLPVKVSPKVR